jgi:transposase
MDAATAERITSTLPLLDERQRRLYLANEARAIGYGGVSQVSRASGVSRPTIIRGLREASAEGYEPENTDRCRKAGGGRKLTEESDPDVLVLLEKMLEPHTKGDPESPLRWTSKSLRDLEQAMGEAGYTVSDTTIGQMLRMLGYSLQANRKELAASPAHPDRDAQFRHISDTAKSHMGQGLPVISIDAKKKELIGNFKNNGREYRKKGEPVLVLDHDFPIKELGKATPYGIYDIFKNSGFVNVGVSADTAEFAVESIRRWWLNMGSKDYPDARSVYVTADSGGSNGIRVRLWKVKLQELADELGLTIKVSHFPPGTSKWNKIEHRLFSFISKNWRGKPLISLAVIVDLIGATTTETGLTVRCVLDEREYARGIDVSEEELKMVNIIRDDFHGEWNYEIRPTGVADL